MSKRLFQVLDEMNVNDEKNKTALLPCSFMIVAANSDKRGGLVTMGVEAHILQKIFLGEMQPVLVVLDKKEYARIEKEPIKSQTSEELQKQIEQEAKDEAYKLTCREPMFKIGYEAGYSDAGEKYADKAQAAEARADRYEKALLEIAGQMCDYNIDQGNIKKHSQHCRACKAKSALLATTEALTPKTDTNE